MDERGWFDIPNRRPLGSAPVSHDASRGRVGERVRSARAAAAFSTPISTVTWGWSLSVAAHAARANRAETTAQSGMSAMNDA
ncbi:hypothetical protein [Burkholderia pseudomallei]|uniref:hypothetical protein n=1 Tax=Burkholderia pseudomallei TaxID=28450 RepID=UPI000A1A00CB|nr:hypothetical protein BOC36_15475 [Burkholderia pseudomallei]